MLAENPYQQYQKQSIMTMTQGELVVQLFRGCSKKLNYAVYHIENGETEKADQDLYGAQRIVNYLNASLDNQYDISANLHALYDYFIRMIIKGKIRMDAEIIKEIIPMIDRLGDSFQEAEKIVHKK
ncbi:flagellar export chaperone FliS [Porcipelethomonas sp.]|uniref:flagellar export chaperone FliS n=1 Tax=Porcipelethomonas sp. TaxID=2981675 RepID=UPI003EF5291C